MPDLPISGLPAITVPNNSYLLAAVSESVTAQMSLTEVAAAISSSFTASQAVSSSYALTASYWESVSSYVPYTGATTNVNLGGNTLYADEVIINPAGFGLLAALSRDITGAGFGSLVLKNGATGYLTPTSSLTVDRTYLLPDKNGTVAMLSDIGAAFPYTGSAQITGSLGVTGSTSVSGSSSIIGGFNIRNFTAFGDPASLQFRTYHDDATTDGAWYSWGTEFLQMGPINSGTDATYTMALVPADNSTGYIPVDRPSLLFNADSQIYLNGSKNFRIYSPSTGKTFTVGNMATVLSGSLTVSGSITQNNVISSLVKADSNGMLTAATGGVDYIAPAYLSAWHSASLTIPTANTPCTMSFSTTDFSYGGITISGSYADKIKFATGGIYNIQFSAQTNKTTGTSSDLNIWLAKNGTEVDNSNTGVTLAGGANDVAIPAWNFFVSASAGDYYQLIFAASDTNTLIEYLPSGSARSAGPAIPSVILTVNRIA